MLMFDDSTEQWNREVEEMNFTGNESDATRETSLYVSLALVCRSDGSYNSGPSGRYELEPRSEDECLSRDESNNEWST